MGFWIFPVQWGRVERGCRLDRREWAYAGNCVRSMLLWMRVLTTFLSASLSIPIPIPSLSIPQWFLSLFIYLFPTSINNVISTPLLFNLVFMLWECLKNGLIRIMLLLNSEKWELYLISHLPLTHNSDQALHTTTELQTHTHYIFRSYLCFSSLVHILYMF